MKSSLHLCVQGFHDTHHAQRGSSHRATVERGHHRRCDGGPMLGRDLAQEPLDASPRVLPLGAVVHRGCVRKPLRFRLVAWIGLRERLPDLTACAGART